MALIVKDRVRQTTTTTGTGTITFTGSVVGFQDFSAIGNGNTTYYAIVDATTGDWEVGLGTYTASGTTFSRDAVYESSNSNNLVNFAVGTKDVFCTYPADRAIYTDATGTVITSASGGVIIPRVVQIADAASVTINADTTDVAYQTNTQAVGTLTINAPTGTPVSGQKLIFRLQSTNIQTFSWNAIFQGSTDLSLPTASTGSSKYDYMGFIYNTVNSKWQMVAKNFGF